MGRWCLAWIPSLLFSSAFTSTPQQRGISFTTSLPARDPFVKYRAPQQKRKLGRRPGRTRRRRVTFMSCPASAGAAETANGAVERMVLLGLTGVYYIIFAASTVRTKSNPPRNLPRRSFSEGGTAAQLAAPFPLAPIVHLAISSQRWCAGPGILTLRQCPKTSVEIYSC